MRRKRLWYEAAKSAQMFTARNRGSLRLTQTPRPRSPRALTDTEQGHIRSVLNSPRFADCTPRQISATLLDEGSYLCHWRTF